MRLLHWPGPDEAPRSKRPYRDAAIVYAGMAAFVVVAAFLTGGDIGRALIFAGIVYVIALSWTWLHLRRRARSEERS